MSNSRQQATLLTVSICEGVGSKSRSSRDASCPQRHDDPSLGMRAQKANNQDACMCPFRIPDEDTIFPISPLLPPSILSENRRRLPVIARNRRHETVILPEWNGGDDCFLCLPKKSLQGLPARPDRVPSPFRRRACLSWFTCSDCAGSKVFGGAIIRRIEKTLDLIDSLAGIVVANLGESTRVR
jgi:hypothetical protein